MKQFGKYVIFGILLTTPLTLGIRVLADTNAPDAQTACCGVAYCGAFGTCPTNDYCTSHCKTNCTAGTQLYNSCVTNCLNN